MSFTVVKTHKTYIKNEPYVNYRLEIIRMCQCVFIDLYKCTTVEPNVESGAGAVGNVCVEVSGIGEISVPYAQFCSKPKTTLKK